LPQYWKFELFVMVFKFLFFGKAILLSERWSQSKIFLTFLIFFTPCSPFLAWIWDYWVHGYTLKRKISILKSFPILKMNGAHFTIAHIQITRRNLVFFHLHTLWLLSDLITFQLHLAILNLLVVCCNNEWLILFIIVTFIMWFTYEFNLDLI
jgi:hypothetical protein